MFKFLVSVLPAILCAITSVGQTVKVTGKVVGSDKKYIQAVAVTIQNKQGKLLGGSITDSLGNFLSSYFFQFALFVHRYSFIVTFHMVI